MIYNNVYIHYRRSSPKLLMLLEICNFSMFIIGFGDNVVTWILCMSFLMIAYPMLYVHVHTIYYNMYHSACALASILSSLL